LLDLLFCCHAQSISAKGISEQYHRKGCPVMLSVAKHLAARRDRSFAALRMTSLISKYLIEGRTLLFVALVAVVSDTAGEFH